MRLTTTRATSDVLIYELNEVPWLVIDRYLSQRPDSTLARVLRRSDTRTTVLDDPNPLEPWRTWPSFHTGLKSSAHRSLDLGQDPSTLRGVPIWDAAAAAGHSVGVFGALQSWPAKAFPAGGFYVPDTFARSPECIPASLNDVQAINLRLTQDNTFNATAPIGTRMLASAPFQMVRGGVSLRTAARLGAQLAVERVDRKRAAERSMLQALPMFDVFMRQLRRVAPDLSIFFTNHVAGMMHRYWADAMAPFGDSAPYRPDPYAGLLVWKAMDVFDRQLAVLEHWAATKPGREVIVLSGMGQAAIPYKPVENTYVVTDPGALLAAAGCAPASIGLAMYPAYSFEFSEASAARHAQGQLEGLTVDGVALFEHLRIAGKTLHVDVYTPHADQPVATTVRSANGRRRSLAEFGIDVQARIGGGNTAHHVPEGIYVRFGGRVARDERRRSVDLCALRNEILVSLGVDEAVAPLRLGNAG